MLGVVAASSASGTWWARQVPSIGSAVDLLRPGPALGRAQHDHRPARAARRRRRRGRARWIAAISSSTSSSVAAIAWCIVGRVVALDEVRLVAVAAQQARQLLLRDAREDGGVGDLVAVEVQDRQHRAVVGRVRGTCWSASWPRAGRSPPRRRRRRSATTQVGVVEGRAVGVRRARSPARRPRGSSRASRARRGSGCRRGRRTAGTAAACPRRPGEMSRVDLAVGALQVGVGHQRRARRGPARRRRSRPGRAALIARFRCA